MATASTNFGRSPPSQMRPLISAKLAGSTIAFFATGKKHLSKTRATSKKMRVIIGASGLKSLRPPKNYSIQEKGDSSTKPHEEAQTDSSSGLALSVCASSCGFVD